MLMLLFVHARGLSTTYYLRLLHPQLGGSARAKDRVLPNAYYILHLPVQFGRGTCSCVSELFYL